MANVVLFISIFASILDPPKNIEVIRIVNNDSLSISLSWDRSTQDPMIDGYTVYRSSYELLGSLIQDTIYTDKGVKQGHDYYYNIVKREKFREDETLAGMKIVDIPYNTVKDTVVNGERRIIIKWKRPDDLYLGEEYEIWRMDVLGEYEPIGSVPVGVYTFKDTTMKDGIKYFYKIAAVKEPHRSFSDPSGAVSTIGAPNYLFAKDTPNDEGESFTVNWELSPNDAMIKNYLLLRLIYDSLTSFKATYSYKDTTAQLGVDYRYSVVKAYQITMPAVIVADSLGDRGRVITIEWNIDPKVIGQDYDLTLIFRAEAGESLEFEYVDYTAPSKDKFYDGRVEKGLDYVYEARAIKEISIPFQLTGDSVLDSTRTVCLGWKPSKEPDEFQGYVVSRADRIDGTYALYARLGKGVCKYTDRVSLFNNLPYAYKLVGITDDNEQVFSETTPYVICTPQWFHTGRINTLIGLVIFVSLVIIFIQITKTGRQLFVRRIAGLSAIDEAVGRATEMGRPILYVPGTSTISDVATIASLNILGEIAKKTAQYATPLIVPNRDPIVYTVAREVVKESYNEVGRPDAYNPDSVYFVADAQFAYAAAVDGIMVREKTATNFLVGMFWAESLIMAETGAATGAIQIAGTDAVTQLPFFITACDYTLIGEELYAASAYISKNPTLLAALKSQDYSKLVIAIVMVLGTILALIHLGVPVFNFFNIQ